MGPDIHPGLAGLGAASALDGRYSEEFRLPTAFFMENMRLLRASHTISLVEQDLKPWYVWDAQKR